MILHYSISFGSKSAGNACAIAGKRFPTFSSRILYLTWIEWYGFYSIVIPVYVFLLVPPIVAALRRDTISFMGTGRLLGQGHYR
jgi:hypothetical protein